MDKKLGHAAEMRRCLLELDAAGMRRLWRHVAPHLPQPRTDAEAIRGMHLARTQAKSIPERFRFYSHRWLVDNGYPSGLPDELKPMAERIYPRVVDGVGISALHRAPGADLVMGAMEKSVLESYGDDVTDPATIKRRMMEARAKERRALFGRR